jgi:hypothetical protein
VLLTAGLIAMFLTYATVATTPQLHFGQDLRVYQAAGQDLYTSGSPYVSSPGRPEETQFRYPPLLAILAPVLTFEPVWYTLMVLGALWPFVLGYRSAGPIGVALPLAVLGPTLHGIFSGNIQPLACGWHFPKARPSWTTPAALGSTTTRRCCSGRWIGYASGGVRRKSEMSTARRQVRD